MFELLRPGHRRHAGAGLIGFLLAAAMLLPATAGVAQSQPLAQVQSEPEAGSLEHECVAAATAPPGPLKVKHTRRRQWTGPIHGYQFVFHSTVKIRAQQLPEGCPGKFRATGQIGARYRDTKHKGWWLDAGAGLNFRHPPRGPISLESFILSSKKEIGCLKAVQLSFTVKVLDLSNGATAARRTFRRPVQRLTCSGQPVRKKRRSSSRRPAGARELKSVDPEVRERCIGEAIAKPPTYIGRLRFKPGFPPGNRHRERWTSKLFFKAMSSDCRGNVGRIAYSRLQIENPRRRGRWKNVHGRKWHYVNDHFEAGWVGGSWPGDGKIDRGITAVYACSPGPRKTGVRELLRVRAFGKETGQPVLAQRIYTLPIKVRGAC